MLDGGAIAFDGAYADFRKSNSPTLRPYLELMPSPSVNQFRLWLSFHYIFEFESAPDAPVVAVEPTRWRALSDSRLAIDFSRQKLEARKMMDSSSPRRQIWRTIRRTQSVKHVLRTQARPEICAAKRRGTGRLRSNQPVRSWTSGHLRRPEQFRRSSPSRRNVGA